MFYGLCALNVLILTRKNVLGEDSETPWLTTNKSEAERFREKLCGAYPKITVELVQVSAMVPWKKPKYRM